MTPPDRVPQRDRNNLNPGITPFTVSVYPIQQAPGVWFANYMISEYRNGAEHVVANVSMRHATHRSETKAKQAARQAGERVAVRMRQQHHRVTEPGRLA
ncbi:isochorismatase [Cupriavidus pauculus]|uniref:Isochorismatase n=1 Tax=Cupriavidus pauculus TaxID=82633 RepID=A0A3G8H8W1_9BURK|nr:isochorismatase [Cupriavidus pauculus]